MAWTERYVRADAAGGGDGTTNTNSGANGAWTLAEAITNAAAGQRLNVKTGTYAFTTTAMTFANDGTATAVILWRGFDTTIGDLDVEPQSGSLTRPSFTTTSGQMSFSTVNYNTFQNINFSSSANDIAQSGTSQETTFIRCGFTCTWANSVGYAWGCANQANLMFVGCSFSATSTATAVVSLTGSSTTNVRFVGCYFTGGDAGLFTSSLSVLEVIGCVFNTHDTYGIRIDTDTAVRLTVSGCTFYSCATACISTSASQTQGILLVNNAYVSSGLGFDFTDCELVVAVGSLYYSLTSGLNAGTGDIPSLGEVSDPSAPFVNAPTDLTLKTTSTGIGAGFPRPVPSTAYSSYADIGAVQGQASAGGGAGPLVGPGRLIR